MDGRQLAARGDVLVEDCRQLGRTGREESARASEGAAGGDVTDVADILKKYACV